MHTELYVKDPTDTVVIAYPPDFIPETVCRQTGSHGTVDPLGCLNTIGVKFKPRDDKAALLKPYGHPIEYYTENIKQTEVNEMAAGYGVGYDLNTWGKFAEEKLQPKFVPVMPKDQWVSIHERSRTYHFAGGKSITIDKPTWLFVSSSGTHYVTGTSGLVHIVSKAWLQIVITE